MSPKNREHSVELRDTQYAEKRQKIFIHDGNGLDSLPAYMALNDSG